MEGKPEELNENLDSLKNNRSRLIGIIAVLIIAILVLSILFGVFLSRSPKSTVKDVAKVVKNVDLIGAMDLIDIEGMSLFLTYNNIMYAPGDAETNYEYFDDYYEVMDKAFNRLKKELKKGNYSIDVTETKKISDSKKLTRVTCDIKIKYKSNEIKLTNMKIYTMKKGLKNYIVGIDPESIEKAERQLEKQEDELEDIGKDLNDIVDDLEDDYNDVYDSMFKIREKAWKKYYEDQDYNYGYDYDDDDDDYLAPDSIRASRY